MDNFSIVGTEAHNITRTTNEAMYLSINDPSLDRNIGKLQLHHILYEVLLNTPALHLYQPLSVSSHNWPTPPLLQRGQGLHSLHYADNTSKYDPTPGGAKPHLAPCVSLGTFIGATCGKHNFGEDNIFLQTQ